MHQAMEFIEGNGRMRIRSEEIPLNSPIMSAWISACDVASPYTKDVGESVSVIKYHSTFPLPAQIYQPLSYH